MTTLQRFAPGTMVRARNREWVVLPSDDPEILRLRPLGGTDEDACSLYLPLEGNDVHSATLELPDPTHAGTATQVRLLELAVRLGFRSAAGPFRSLARIAVEPRPYQLVPLLMALRHDPVRLLIGDDVGIGKTIEACLIARELLDRGEIQRLVVLCPPPLCEQWADELQQKFHLSAVVVRPGTIGRLERDLPVGRSPFQEYPVTVASIDFMKMPHRAAIFVDVCPELVIVDEAHNVARAGGVAQQQRHALIKQLARDPNRHIILTTATPHSGDEGAFASLIGLLDPSLEPEIAEGRYAAGTEARRRLAQIFVQRRRGDISSYARTETSFPTREPMVERAYQLSREYRELLDGTLAYSRHLVRDVAGLSQRHQRVRYWAALALLRCVSSSPAAAAAALRIRAANAAGEDVSIEGIDRTARAQVLDEAATDETLQDDATPGADTVEDGVTLEHLSDADERSLSADRRELRRLARLADQIAANPAADPKLAAVADLVEKWVKDGFQPIVFCRYVATAHYVAAALERRLRGVAVQSVTGELPPEERAARVAALAEAPKRVLVATDCLSEGINLQRSFNAVIHYDLAWNPTRHEQRDGRVDRFNQPSPKVRTALIYGRDNHIDGHVLEVLLRKADTIRRNLGIAVPVPVDTGQVMEAILEAVLLRAEAPAEQLSLFQEQEQLVERAWKGAEERERRTRTVFAQHSIRAEELVPILEEARAVIGTSQDVHRFLRDACAAYHGALTDGATPTLDPRLLPEAVRLRAGLVDEPLRPVRLAFDLPAPDDAIYLPRTHPLVEALASYVLDAALAPGVANDGTALAARCALIRTADVSTLTTVLLLRARYLLEQRHGGRVTPTLAEDVLTLVFSGDPQSPEWLDPAAASRLMEATPAANPSAAEAAEWIRDVLEARPYWWPQVLATVRERGQRILEQHERVRQATQARGARATIAVQEAETDLLGIIVLLPQPRSRR